MKKKTKRKIVTVWLPLLALLLASGVACRARKPAPRSLVLSGLTFSTAADAQLRLTGLLQNGDLGKTFKRERLNFLLPGNRWAGRVKDNNFSQQALFFVDNMSAQTEVKSRGENRFTFSIFHPDGSQLSYRVYLEAQGKRRLAFERHASRREFFTANIDIDRSWRKFRLILETSGQGIGAWMNPRFVRLPDKPRIFVVIVLDSVRADHTSLYGYGRRTTPALDKLALDARVFRRAFSSTSWTLPAHASLFSGMDLAGHRVLGPADRLGEDYPLLAEVFQKNGFATAAFTGGGFVDDQYGFHRGFEVYSNRSGDVFLTDSAERVLKNFRRFAEAVWGEDLFVFLHTYQAHAPYKFPAQFKAAINPDLGSNLLGSDNFLEDKKVECFKELPAAVRQELLDLYDTAIFYADQALVGGVADYLKEKGAYDEATIAVLSDHGEEFYDHGSWEHGHSLYNELIRIPLVIKFPRSRWRGTDNVLTSIADIPSLLLKDSGLESPQDLLRDARRGKKRVLPVALPVSPIIKEIPAKVSFVDDRFHFIYNMIDRKALDVFVPRPPEPQAYEFYDRKDEGEAINLAASRPQALKEFHARLAEYLRRLRAARGRERELDESLRRELKSLGYLND